MPFVATPDNLAGAAHTLAVATCDEASLSALTPREQHEYAALPHAARRRDWLAGRCAAKRAIRARWDMPADRIELRAVRDAAPEPHLRTATGGSSPLPDRLTITHRDGFALAVVFHAEMAVGVDVERAGDLSPLQLRYFLSEDERARHDGMDATLLWVLKEAAWKALRLGPGIPLSSLQLVFGQDVPDLFAVRLGAREIAARARVARIDAALPLVAALVEIGEAW